MSTSSSSTSTSSPAPDTTPPSCRPTPSGDDNFYIAAVGSSAGGLTAVENFFGNMTATGSVAFVLVTHMAAEHESMIKELLRKYTFMPVIEAADGMRLEADKIYYVSGNAEVDIHNRFFRISNRRGPAPIDYFMSSLAGSVHQRSIGIILSGAGSDGTRGIQKIKAAEGLTMAQDPETADHLGMPRSAIASQAIDLILPPREMPRQIIKWIQNAGVLAPEDVKQARKDSAEDLQRIFFLLKSTTGHDFTLYKKNTIKRRLERRMTVHNIELLSDYVRFLENDEPERIRLLKELLIGVTNFFRDPEAFEVLKREVLIHLLRHYERGRTLRIWVAACSSGEEAYSIAITVMEVCSEMDWDVDLKIFASDIDKDAIDMAREGIYPITIETEMSPERLKRFFTFRLNEYQIRKEVKEKIVFSHHDITRDPPFSKLDMISCRNLMIYMEPILQQKLLRIFHYSLLPGGILFMGNSETIGDANGLFTTFDKRWKFFERKTTFATQTRGTDFAAFRTFVHSQPETSRSTPIIPRKMAVRDLSHEILMNQFVPPSIVCDELGDILFIHGKTANYLEPPMGEARMNVFAMARDDLKLEVSRGIQKVLATGEGVRYGDLKVKLDSQYLNFDLTIRLLSSLPHPGRLLLVTFEEGIIEQMTPENTIHIDSDARDEHAREIERELLFTREHMQTLVEQLETSNEELKSMNEELQSSNEELQSSNEELETAKEELQAVNEELVTVNAELYEKIEELSTANNDLDNFLSSSAIATIFLDRRFLITRYSRSTTKIFNLIPSDIGRSLGDIVSQIKYEDILSDAEEVLNNLSTLERNVALKDGRWLFMRITPYKTTENVIDGVVIGFSDISEQRRLERQAKFLHHIVEFGRLPVLVFDKHNQIIYTSRELHAELGYKDGEIINSNFADLGQDGRSGDAAHSQTLDAGTGKIRLKMKNGEYKEFNSSIDSISDESELKCVIVTPA